MVTMAGQPLWADTDGVHLTADAYEEIGSLFAAFEEPVEAATKRSRLESVVPGPPAKRRPGAVISPSPWVMGAEGRGSHRGRPFRGGRGGRGRGERGAGRGRPWPRPRGRRGRAGYKN